MKTKEEARANLEASISYIPDRYRSGVAKADWQTKASSDAAERNFADAMAKAVSAKSRQTGVRKVANTEWQRLAGEKGGAVIGERIRGALDKQAAKWGPIYDAVAGTVGRLPPRTVDFRANITARCVPTVESWKRAAGKL
ncbi:MAG: hypothetical protein KKD77_22720 [Gammaproteobacteria bacterium]|nr:hypothetical protein [Gammaproteobacteria bacterium]